MEEGKIGVKNWNQFDDLDSYAGVFLLLPIKKTPTKPQPTNNIVVISILMFTFWLDPAKCPFSRIK